MSSEEFSVFMSPGNWAAQLLILHMFLLEHVTDQYLLRMDPNIVCKVWKRVLVAWVKNFDKRLPAEYQKCMEWPRTYCKTLENAI
jgi:hypothetical protein